MTNAMGVAQGAREEAQNALRGMMDRWLADRDFVTREEFEAVRAMAQKAREENRGVEGPSGCTERQELTRASPLPCGAGRRNWSNGGGGRMTMDDNAPRTRIQARNRGAILDAALEVFSAQGYRGATLDLMRAPPACQNPTCSTISRPNRRSTLACWKGFWILGWIRCGRSTPTASRWNRFSPMLGGGNSTWRETTARKPSLCQ